MNKKLIINLIILKINGANFWFLICIQWPNAPGGKEMEFLLFSNVLKVDIIKYNPLCSKRVLKINENLSNLAIESLSSNFLSYAKL